MGCITLTILSWSGKIPVKKDSFIRITSGNVTTDFKCKKGILKGPTDFLVCICEIILNDVSFISRKTKMETLFLSR